MDVLRNVCRELVGTLAHVLLTLEDGDRFESAVQTPIYKSCYVIELPGLTRHLSLSFVPPPLSANPRVQSRPPGSNIYRSPWACPKFVCDLRASTTARPSAEYDAHSPSLHTRRLKNGGEEQQLQPLDHHRV